jgi:hypothetical protein
MRVRKLIANSAVTLFSLMVGLTLCEMGARLLLNPADYLSVTATPDPVLGMTIAPNSAGFDGWGFRNPSVPETVDVVTLGDSHTFGNTAKADDGWPRVVGRNTGLTVYNLGVGGYGPNQYYHLLTTRGLSLHPKHVVCGLYMGDDFENAYSITYGLDHWAFLRAGHREKVNADIWGDAEPPGRFKIFRNWLSRTSMVYRLVVHGPVLSALKGSLQFRQIDRSADPSVTTIENADKKIREAFRPVRIAAGLDQSRPEVREGMRITFHFLNEMDQLCRKNHCSFSVVIIPTKETVFADYLQADQHLHLKDSVDAVIANERAARAALGKWLDERDIPYVDTLPALRQAVSNELYYRGPADMHPSKNGYKVIGDVVSEFLREVGSRSK